MSVPTDCTKAQCTSRRRWFPKITVSPRCAWRSVQTAAWRECAVESSDADSPERLRVSASGLVTNDGSMPRIRDTSAAFWAGGMRPGRVQRSHFISCFPRVLTIFGWGRYLGFGYVLEVEKFL